ncbi:hypothetical protein AB4Z40_26870, partial [Bosea sp. 2YAB26]
MVIRAFAVAAFMVAAAWAARAEEPLALRGMGSFHVGGKLVEISGRPVKEVTFTPGGVPAKVDPNGTYQTGQMYVQGSLRKPSFGGDAERAPRRHRPLPFAACQAGYGLAWAPARISARGSGENP